MKNRALFVLGTRPEIIKIAPIANKISSIILFTGQHFDSNMSNDFFELLDVDEIRNLHLNKENNISVQEMAFSISNEIQKIDCQKIIVQGDTNSTLAGAIAAKYLSKKLFFIESGMRSGDLLQIEEYNRILISHLSDINFCNHENNKNNLIKENIQNEKIKVTGSTVYSSLKLATKLNKNLNNYENYILLTLHRPENVDNVDKLKQILNSIEKLEFNVIFPIHPRTRKKLNSLNFKNIKLVEPQNYFSFINLMEKSIFIISDSGGVQEEAAILRKPLIIPRDYTERPEMLGKFNLLAKNTKELFEESKKVLNNSSVLCSNVINNDLLYGEDEPIDKIIDYIRE